MNQRKGFIPIAFLPATMVAIIIVFAVIMFAPLVFASVFPIFKFLMMGYFCLIIFMFVRGILGNSLLTYLISGVLIYIFIVRLWWLFAPAYMIYLIASMGLSGIIIFGLQRG